MPQLKFSSPDETHIASEGFKKHRQCGKSPLPFPPNCRKKLSKPLTDWIGNASYRAGGISFSPTIEISKSPFQKVSQNWLSLTKRDVGLKSRIAFVRCVRLGSL